MIFYKIRTTAWRAEIPTSQNITSFNFRSQSSEYFDTIIGNGEESTNEKKETKNPFDE